jgi:hypothetical protein
LDALEPISVLVGVAGLRFGVVKYNGERAAQAEVARLDERRQAEQVTAWAGKRTEEGRPVFIRNGSDQIVRDVKAWLVIPSDPPPGDAAPGRDPVTQRAVLEPGDTLEHLIRSLRRPAPKERPPAILTFTDAEGRDWMRTHEGRLLRRWPIS